MLVYVSACMHSSMDAFLHACVCVYVCPNLYRSPPVCIYVRSLCVHACMHACMYLILFQCAYIYMCICVCICMYVHTHTLSGTASNAFTCHCSSKKLSQDHNMLTTGGKKIKRSQRLQEMGGKLQAEAGCRVHVHFDSVG